MIQYGRILVLGGEVHVVPKRDGEMNHHPRSNCGCWPDKQWDREAMKWVYLHRPTKSK